MKLCRIKTENGVLPAAVDQGGKLRDLSAHISDIAPETTSPEALKTLSKIEIASLPEITGTYAPILSDVRRLLCIGLNYTDHAEEMNLPIPEFPILFMKACPVTGANDPIIIPKGSEKTDWEVEMGIIIGSRAQHVTEDDAMDHVAGYCVVNDVSERTFQLEMGGQWMKGKSCDSFAPVGPWFVTSDEVPDPQVLDLYLDVNGERRQTGTTARMIFSIAQIVSFVSRFVTLVPGDIIATGTPPGVGVGMKPQKFLKAGDVVTLGITGLGDQQQEAIPFSG
ncbi:2-hydroxyhepta-2,4-diene-1,7-dioate isomerase [Sulfitobacter sp. SK012]|uniref:fumarylacetoacetate hydrolase family protein n=1 Tax=Sulfitobacter sp. SK012 TaxID=1389005 RepID=UPI000E0CA8C8|nr:fumarylacetoacetate hydrolase family protein [Sulfitobacter sp. SK012]AXI44580.1 2-hydroxyhepta-2,4-diene-1,7-dioate isomerase [Sulfitobacter sp. SK012]